MLFRSNLLRADTDCRIDLLIMLSDKHARVARYGQDILILIADGCDMTKGRARIPMEMNSKPSVGDIHKYSANSIEKVKILQGKEKPIKIEVHMSADVGFFQIEEVLLQKINNSPAKNLVELFAGVEGQDEKQYL